MEIVEAAKINYGTHTQDADLYCDERGLRKDAQGHEGYVDALPKDKSGDDFIKMMTRRTSTREIGQSQIKLLDVGCGKRGKFLVDVKKEWGEAIDCAGISARIDSTKLLDEMGIKATVGDAQNLRAYYESGSLDVITAVRSLEYLIDPWNTLREIYSLLNAGGIALINCFPIDSIFDGNYTEKQIIKKYLEEQYGAIIETPESDTPGSWSIVLEKQKEKNILQLPLIPTEILAGGSETGSKFSILQQHYRLTNQK